MIYIWASCAELMFMPSRGRESHIQSQNSASLLEERADL